jgi:hypothetical protein
VKSQEPGGRRQKAEVGSQSTSSGLRPPSPQSGEGADLASGMQVILPVTHLDALPEGVLLYTKSQMAAAMQVSIRCLTGMMNRGEVSYFKINGRNVRFLPVAALRRLIETSLLIEGVGAAEAIADGRWLKAEHLFPARFLLDGTPHPALSHLLPRAEKANNSAQ